MMSQRSSQGCPGNVARTPSEDYRPTLAATAFLAFVEQQDHLPTHSHVLPAFAFALVEHSEQVQALGQQAQHAFALTTFAVAVFFSAVFGRIAFVVAVAEDAQQVVPTQHSHALPALAFASHEQAGQTQLSPQQAQPAFALLSSALAELPANTVSANAVNMPIISRQFIVHLLF